MHPHKRKQLVLLAIALAALVTVVAWNWDSSSGHPGPLALYHGEWNEDDSLIQGTLIREGDCLYVQRSEDRSLLTLATRGTRWDEGAQAVRAGGVRLGIGNFGVRFGGASFHVGDEVSFGGSGAHGDGAELVARLDWAEAPDPSCDVTNVWLAGAP